MGPIDCALKSTGNYHYTLRNIQEERRAHKLFLIERYSSQIRYRVSCVEENLWWPQIARRSRGSTKVGNTRYGLLSTGIGTSRSREGRYLDFDGNGGNIMAQLYK